MTSRDSRARFVVDMEAAFDFGCSNHRTKSDTHAHGFLAL